MPIDAENLPMYYVNGWQLICKKLFFKAARTGIYVKAIAVFRIAPTQY